MWTQQDRSRTPSTLIWSSRLYKFIQDVKSTLHVEPAGQKPNTFKPSCLSRRLAETKTVLEEHHPLQMVRVVAIIKKIVADNKLQMRPATAAFLPLRKPELVRIKPMAESAIPSKLNPGIRRAGILTIPINKPTTANPSVGASGNAWTPVVSARSHLNEGF